MSQHNSFGSGSSSGSQRSVLKRYEKLEALQKKGLWDETKGCHNLPKVKVMRIKAKKEAKAAAPEAAGAAAPAAGAKAAAPAAKAAAPAKDAKAKK